MSCLKQWNHKIRPPAKTVERSSPFEGPPFPELGEAGGEVHLLLLASHSHRTNHKQDDTQWVRLYYQPRLLTCRKFCPEKSSQSTPTNSGFISLQCSIFTQCGETKTFPKELEKFVKWPYDFKYAQRVKHHCHFTSKTISFTNLSFISYGKGSSGSGSTRYVEKRCNFNSRTSARTVSEFNIFDKEKGRGNGLVISLKVLYWNTLMSIQKWKVCFF